MCLSSNWHFAVIATANVRLLSDNRIDTFTALILAANKMCTSPAAQLDFRKLQNIRTLQTITVS